jgi:hypothetical protein
VAKKGIVERRRSARWWLAVVVGLLAPFMVPEAARPASAAPRCGAQDLPETGVAGDVPIADQLSGRADQGYNCGLALVGYSSLGARGGNANMAWAGDCAYIAGDGVAVVDVRDPAHPRVARTLHGPGADATIETISAVEAPGRSLLATGRYGLFGATGLPGSGPVDLWDVQDCLHPKLLTEIAFPSNVHNLTLTADGKRLWSTLPLQAADISDLHHPKLLPDIESQIAATSRFHLQYAHEAWPSPDGKRLYIGGQEVGDEELLVVDIEGWPRRPARVLGGLPHPGHSIRPMTIDGSPFLIASDESIINPTAKGCLPDALTPFGGASRPSLIDISNEDLPRIRSTISLPINQPLHCVDQTISGVNASVHYQDVDDPDDTTFAMASMWNAGLRIFDVRDPAHPREAAYFNPGRFGGNPFPTTPGLGTLLALQGLNGLDQAWAHSRYRPETGQVWLTTATGGFWVLELEPQVRAALGLPAKPVAHPNGAAPRPPVTHALVSTLGAADAASYCALSTARIL